MNVVKADVTKKIKIYIALLSIILIWGYSWVLMKLAMHYVSPAIFTAYRCILAFLVLYFILKVRKKDKNKIEYKYLISIGLLQTAGMLGLSQLALVFGAAGKVSILTYTMPVWFTLLSAIYLKEQITTSKLALMILLFIGMMVVIHPWSEKSSTLSYVFAVLSGLSWAASAVIIKKLYIKHPETDLLALTTYQMLYGSIILFLTAIISKNYTFEFNSISITALMYNSILATAGGWFLWAYILKNTTSSIAGMSLILVPIFGSFFSWLFLGEILSLQEISGVAIILVVLVGIKIIR